MRKVKNYILKKIPKKIKYRLKADLGLSGYPSWAKIISNSSLEWDKLVFDVEKSGSKRILIATSSGGHRAGNITESAIAASLIQRGVAVDVLLCDAALPGCIISEYQYVKNELDVFFREGPNGVGLCYGCHKQAAKMWSELGVNVLNYSDYISDADRGIYETLSRELSFSDILEYRDDNGYFIGEHAKSGALRFLCKGELQEGDYQSEQALRKYFVSSLVVAHVMKTVLGERKYEAMVCFHGIYVPHGVIGEVCRKESVRVVNWNTSYRKRRFIFSHGDTYHKTMISEPEVDWKHFEFTDSKKQEITDYLVSREKGTGDWQQFNENPEESITSSAQLSSLDFSKPIVTLLPNVVWDAQLHYSSNVFESLIEWALYTVEYFQKRRDVQLIVRVHPAEIKRHSPSRQPLEQEIRNRFPVLSSNIFIVPADDKVSTYRLAEVSDTTLIYGTKTGIELTSRSQNVVVCGEAWIKGKGFTTDPVTPEEYEKILDQIPFGRKLSPGQTNDALRFAYHFFNRRAIYLDFLKETKDSMAFNLNINDLEELSQGRNKGLDAICDGIVNGRKFIVDD
ncbi:capsule biosynthesis protein [Teredinibacter sp. KSP-S5-2]|uniref:capsule biosynthesis protein n=1 Tax=Teredinibacter sp. KSP-S5-2 TaxID=3034506 RepID=UPI0029347CF8|nr:capsule biosynthesis protein [Teredinibacter sp. KSP-S5-2]WNO07864.1 capsule biosynthesis protein [Teredinibacter sp. KSP-S5-2]